MQVGPLILNGSCIVSTCKKALTRRAVGYRIGATQTGGLYGGSFMGETINLAGTALGSRLPDSPIKLSALRWVKLSFVPAGLNVGRVMAYPSDL